MGDSSSEERGDLGQPKPEGVSIKKPIQWLIPRVTSKYKGAFLKK